MSFSGLSPATKKTYESLYARHIQPLKHIQDLGQLVDIWSENLSPATVLKLLSIYKLLHGTDTTRFVKSVSRNLPTDHPVWSKEQATKAIQVSYHINKKLHGPLLVTLHTGLRKSELFSLSRRDVDLENHSLHVRKTKSGKPRTVPMSPEVESLLRQPLQDPIFRAFEPTKPLQAFCRAADLPYIGWHGLRHTFATILLDAGTSIRTVSDILGHAHVSTTLNVYWQKSNKSIDTGVLP